MTNKNYADITLILDRSGSMWKVWDDTLIGLNKFVEEQKKFPGKTVISLIAFDTEYQVVWDALAAEQIPELSSDISPRGYTALLDAVGKRVIDTGKRLSSLSELERPGQVLFAVFTDGLENSSREFSANRVRDMLQHQTDVYKWVFTYFGAGIDAWQEASKYGFLQRNTISTGNTGVAAKAVYATMGTSLMDWRTGHTEQYQISQDQKEFHKNLANLPNLTSGINSKVDTSVSTS